MDLAWTDDMDIGGAETSSSLEEYEQDMYHLVEQDQGSNLDDPERGLGVANMLSAPIDDGLASQAEQQIQNDDRTNSCTATLSQDTSQGAVGSVGTLNLTITPNEDLLQALDLIIPIGSSTQGAA